jgi:hypothetical protein
MPAGLAVLQETGIGNREAKGLDEAELAAGRKAMPGRIRDEKTKARAVRAMVFEGPQNRGSAANPAPPAAGAPSLPFPDSSSSLSAFHNAPPCRTGGFTPAR